MNLKQFIIPAFVSFTLMAGCNEDEPDAASVVITTEDFTVTIDEDPTEGQILGIVSGTASEGDVSFSITSQDPDDAMLIDTSSGELKVSNAAAFDFETRTSVIGVVAVKSGEVSEEAKITITITDVPVSVTTTDFTASLDENPIAGFSLGNVAGTASEGSVAFAISAQEVADALSIDTTTGELKVNDASAFDFEVRTSMTATVTVTGGSDVKEAKVTLTINNLTEITTSDFEASLDENPTNGLSIGSVKGTTDTGSLTFSISSQNPSGALAIDASTGALTVADKTLFDYESRMTVEALVSVKSGDVSKEANVTLTLRDVSSTWQVVGTAGFSGSASDIHMAIDDSGTPYVVYQDLNHFGYINCKKFDGASWVAVGNEGFSGSEARRMKIVIDNGTPYVTYVSSRLRLPVVKKFDGTSWVDVGGYISTNSSNYTDLAFDNGTPYVLYSDDNNSSKSTVKKFDGTNWVVIGAEGFSDGLVLFNSLAIDNGTSYAAYYDGNDSGKATVMKFDGTNWAVVGSKAFSSGAAQYTSLVIDGSTPYLAYTDWGNSSKASVMKFDGTNWTAIGNAGFSGAGAFYTSLAFDSGSPYLAFQDENNSDKATLMKYDGSSWVNVGSPGFSAGEASFVNLAFANGIPYVAYRDGANGSKTTVMKFDE